MHKPYRRIRLNPQNGTLQASEHPRRAIYNQA